MKKIIFTVIAVALATVSCTKSNLLDAPQTQMTPISFDTYTGKTPTTKAVSETTETLAKNYNSNNKAFHVNAFVPGAYSTTYTSMDVWASSYTDAKDATETTEAVPFSATWTYEGKAYWPSNGKLDFIAYGLNAADHLVPTITGSHTAFTYTVSNTVSEQEDLIVAVKPAESSMPTNGIVSLNFKHLLSRVGFTLKTTQSHDNVAVTINSVVIRGRNFAPTGTLNFLDSQGNLVSEPSITPIVDASVTSYSLFDTEYPGTTYDYFYTSKSPGPDKGIGIYANKAKKGTVTSDTEFTEGNRYMMLIPGAVITGADIYYQLPGANEAHVTANLTDGEITLEKGKAYEFIIKLSTDAIDFRGEVTDWDPVAGTGTTIPQPTPDPEPAE